MENFLQESFLATGTDLGQLEKLLEEIEQRTGYLRLSSKQLTLLSLRNSDNEKLYFEVLDPDPENGLKKFSKSGLAHPNIAIKRETILKQGDFAKVIDEIVEQTNLMFYDGLRFYFVSPSFTKTLDAFGLKGSFLEEPCIERDQCICHQFAKGRECTLVTKREGKMKKVFAILSKNYTHVPQNAMLDVIKQLEDTKLIGKPVCKRWEVNHFYTSIYIEFPEKAAEISALYGLSENLVPGLLLTTSDTGDSSLSIRGTWKIGSSVSLHKEVKRKHSGAVDVKKILDECDKTIFSEYTKLPEALCDLMAIDITDPALDLAKKSSQVANRTTIDETVKAAFKQLGIVAAIGKKKEKQLYDNVCLEFDSSLYFTAYDIAVVLLGLSERVCGLNSITQKELQKAMSRAPYINYKGEAEIYLT